MYKTTKVCSNHSKNGTSVSGNLELTKMKQASNLVKTSAPELWRLPRGAARRRVEQFVVVFVVYFGIKVDHHVHGSVE